MKANGIIQILLVLAVVVLYFLHFSSKKPNTVIPTEGGSSTVVFINEDSLLENYEYFKIKRLELEGEQARAEADLQEKAQKLQTEIANFQKRAQSGTYSPKQLQTMQEDLEQKQSQLMFEQQLMSEDLMGKTQNLNIELKENLDEILDSLRSELNSDYILTYGVQSNILSANQNLDITNRVLEILNSKKQ